MFGDIDFSLNRALMGLGSGGYMENDRMDDNENFRSFVSGESRMYIESAIKC